MIASPTGRDGGALFAAPGDEYGVAVWPIPEMTDRCAARPRMEKTPSPEVFEPAITAEMLELCMDRVAHAIVRDEKRGAAYLPIYNRLEAELAAIRQRATTLDEIRERVRRSLDRSRKPSR
jgi:hypothetical protein